MYDLAIIGGGPGGYVAAERAGTAGLSVVLFEKRTLGGVCLNEGCIPTKTLLYSAKVYDYTRHADQYGVTVDGSSVNFGAVFKRKEKVVRKLVAGVKAKMKNAGVEVVPAEATILGRSAEGFDLTAGEAAYSARKLLICSGSEAVVPPIPGLREGLGSTVVTNREILSLTEQPAELVIIGGGVIGMEFASFFNSVGTKVTVVEMLPKILGPMDDEISAMLQAQYQKKGVVFQLGCKVVAVEGDTVVYEDPDGQTCRVRGDRILVSVGRRAGLQGFGLENLGVELALNPAGRPCGIKVDDRMRTSVPGVYAAGPGGRGGRGRHPRETGPDALQRHSGRGLYESGSRRGGPDRGRSGPAGPGLCRRQAPDGLCGPFRGRERTGRGPVQDRGGQRLP